MTLEVVPQLHLLDALPDRCRDYGRDTVTLGWEDRVKAHGRRRSDGGVEFATSLPRGTVLRAGDYLVLDSARLVVAVVERVEAVFVIEPRVESDWGLFAYHIGNRHQPLMITDEAIVCPEIAGMELLLQQHNIPYSRDVRPFTPVSATVAHQH